MRPEPGVPCTQGDREDTPEHDGASASTSGPASHVEDDADLPAPIPAAGPSRDVSAEHADDPTPASVRVRGARENDDRTRSERVAKIRAAVISGSYPVDLDKLAEKIVDRELLASPATDPSDDHNS